MDDFVIRPLAPDDIEDLTRIQEVLIKKEVRPAWRKAVLHYIEATPASCLGAESSGKLVGYVIGSVKVWGFGMERSGWVEYVGVDPRFMGRGAGQALGSALMRHFRGQKVTTVHTTVRWDSGDLLSFFKSLGFTRSQYIDLELKL